MFLIYLVYDFHNKYCS